VSIIVIQIDQSVLCKMAVYSGKVDLMKNIFHARFEVTNCSWTSQQTKQKKLFRNGGVSNIGSHWREQGRCNGKYNKKSAVYRKLNR